MKQRIKKKGDVIIRRMKSSDRSYSPREAVRLAYFEIKKKKAYIVRHRRRNNILYVGDKKTAKTLFDFYNS